MSLISNINPCSSPEITCLKRYLSSTPVCRLVKCIENGAKVSKGEVESLAKIGQLKTIWSTLGRIYKSYEKFLVREVLPVLLNPICCDIETLNKIREYQNLRAGNKLEIVIILLEENNTITIYDGNKRAVACYEYASENKKDDLTLPVYIITI